MIRQKKNSGFTLAELLIVVAVVGILVAIFIPVFTSQLHKAKVATDEANLRSYYSAPIISCTIFVTSDMISSEQYLSA